MRYVVNAPLLRSLLCLSVRLSICLFLCDALELWVTRGLFAESITPSSWRRIWLCCAINADKTGERYSQIRKRWRSSTNISLYFGYDKDMAIVTMEDEHELVCDVLNGCIYNSLECHITKIGKISRSRYYSTSNNSKMVQNRAILTMAGQK